ncbi:MAG: DUF4153 domain-containing protein [Bacteroidales bacterium]|jgi:hypothetical protein
MKVNLRAITNNLIVIIARNPVEIIISGAFFFLSFLTYEKIMAPEIYGENLLLAPLVFAFSYLLNRVFTTGIKRVLYYLSVLAAAIPFLVNASHWVQSGEYVASLAVAVAFLAIYTNYKDNTRFVRNILAYAKELFFTMAIVTAIFAALIAIFFSFIYLFDIFKDSYDNIAFYTSIVCYIILAPVTFLYLNADDGNKREAFRITKIFEVIINYILAPALIIYTIILYLYIAKIIIGWSLPKGSLAYMVFGFIISAIVIKAGMLMVSKPTFTRFFESFSLIAIAPLALFWIGSLHRISQYGFTEERVYLVVCGAIMTLTVLLFITRKYDKYLYVGYITIVLLSLFSYIPAISAKQIGIKSQTYQLKALATELKMMGAEGKLTAPPQVYDDSLSKAKFERLYSIYSYLARQTDKNLLEYLYGYPSGGDLRTKFGENFTYKEYSKNSIERVEDKFSTSGYPWVNTDVYANVANDTLKVISLKGDEIIAAPLTLLMERLALSAQNDSITGLAFYPDSVLYLDIEKYRVIFSKISFDKKENISKAIVKALLIR